MRAASSTSMSGLLLALAGSIAFSGKAIIVKLSYRHGVDAATVILYRMLFALPFFLLLAWWSGRSAHSRENPLTREDVGRIVALGFVGYYLSSYLDFLGLQYISASLERLILYLNPTFVLILGWVFFKKSISRMRAVAMWVSYCGVLIVFGHEVTLTGTNVWLGTSLVLLSAITYAFYLHYSGQWVKHIGSMRLVGWASSVACVCCVVQFAVLHSWSDAQVPAEVLQLAGINALLCTVAPVLMVMMAIERIGAGLAAQTGMVGPMSTIALGVVWLDEPFNAWILAGTLLVLAGVFLVTKYGVK